MRLKIHLALLSILVVLPLCLGAFALIWLEVCRALFIPGAFLVPLAILAGYLFGIYCKPVHYLFDNLCFSNEAFRGLMSLPLPCDLSAWVGVAAFYALIALSLGMLVNAIIERRRGKRG